MQACLFLFHTMSEASFAFVCHHQDQLISIIDHLRGLMREGHRIFLFRGDLGAGKTTTIKLLGHQLGITGEMTSPTFSLIQEYDLPDGSALIHMDLYRLNTPEELEQIGFSDYIDSGNICLIEWPQIAATHLDVPRVEIDIESSGDKIRKFVVTNYDTVNA